MIGEIGFYGSGLQRAECVLATASGRLYTSDKRGGVMLIDPDGSQRLLGTTEITYQGQTVSLKAPFRRVSMLQAVLDSYTYLVSTGLAIGNK